MWHLVAFAWTVLSGIAGVVATMDDHDHRQHALPGVQQQLLSEQELRFEFIAPQNSNPIPNGDVKAYGTYEGKFLPEQRENLWIVAHPVASNTVSGLSKVTVQDGTHWKADLTVRAVGPVLLEMVDVAMRDSITMEEVARDTNQKVFYQNLPIQRGKLAFGVARIIRPSKEEREL